MYILKMDAVPRNDLENSFVKIWIKLNQKNMNFQGFDLFYLKI